jgi:hypothetical protein
VVRDAKEPNGLRINCAARVPSKPLGRSRRRSNRRQSTGSPAERKHASKGRRQLHPRVVQTPLNAPSRQTSEAAPTPKPNPTDSPSRPLSTPAERRIAEIPRERRSAAPRRGTAGSRGAAHASTTLGRVEDVPIPATADVDRTETGSADARSRTIARASQSHCQLKYRTATPMVCASLTQPSWALPD